MGSTSAPTSSLHGRLPADWRGRHGRSTPVVLVATTVHRAHDQRIVAREAETLVEAGCDVVLVAPGDLIDGGRSAIVHVALAEPRSRGQRIALQWRVAKEIVSRRPDVVHVHDPELIPLLACSRVLGGKIVFDAHESLVEAIDTKTWIASPLRSVAKLGARLLLRVAGSVADVIAATPTIASSFDPPATVVPNYPRLSELAPVEPVLDGSTIVYVGGLQRIRGIDVVVRAVQLLPDTRLVLAGTFTEPDYETWVRSLDVRGVVEFLGWQDRASVARIFAGASVGVIPFLHVGNHENAMPTKLFEYMAAGVPVIASDLPAMAEVLTATGAGATFETGSASDCARALAECMADPCWLRGASQRGRRAALETYNWEASGDSLLSFYSEVLR